MARRGCGDDALVRRRLEWLRGGRGAPRQRRPDLAGRRRGPDAIVPHIGGGGFPILGQMFRATAGQACDNYVGTAGGVLQAAWGCSGHLLSSGSELTVRGAGWVPLVSTERMVVEARI